MKSVFAKITLALATLTALPALADNKLLYIVPDSTSPDGQFVVAAYNKENNVDDPSKNVGFFVSKISANGSLKPASEMIYDHGFEHVNNTYGVQALAWSHASVGTDTAASPYLITNNQSRHNNDLVFLRLVNGKYVKQSYSAGKYEAEIETLLKNAATPLGYDAVKDRVYANVQSTLSAELAANPTDSAALDVDTTDLQFDEPIYVIIDNSYTFKKDGSGDDEFKIVNVTGALKITKNEDGSLKDEKVSLSAKVED